MPAPTPTPTDSYPSEDHTAPRLTSRAASEPRIHGAADARAEPADASSVATLPWPGRWSAAVLAVAEAQVPLSEAELAAMDAAGDGEPRRADVRPDRALRRGRADRGRRRRGTCRVSSGAELWAPSSLVDGAPARAALAGTGATAARPGVRQICVKDYEMGLPEEVAEKRGK